MTEGSQKSVAKNKVSSRVCCSSWTSDGQYFSLGHYNGTVTILSKVWVHVELGIRELDVSLYLYFFLSLALFLFHRMARRRSK